MCFGEPKKKLHLRQIKMIKKTGSPKHSLKPFMGGA